MIPAITILVMLPVAPVPQSRGERDAALEDATRQMTALAEKTLDEAKDAINDPLLVQQATDRIRLLGRLRATCAINFLIEHLTFQPNAGAIAISRPTLEESLPAVYALSEIGHPAFERLVKKIASSDDAATTRYAAMVFGRCLGTRQARAYLMECAAAESDAVKVGRIKSAAEYVQKLRLPG